MSLVDDIQVAVGRLCDASAGLGDGERSYVKLTHSGAATSVTVGAGTIRTFPEADDERGVKAGAELLVVDGKPFEDAGEDLKSGRWRMVAAAGGTDVEVTGRVTGDDHVGYEVTLNPKGSRR